MSPSAWRCNLRWQRICLVITAHARSPRRLVTDLLKKMTVDEKIGRLRLISVGPDNPKEAIREIIKDGQVEPFLTPLPARISARCRIR
ncbi:hypothetical protein ACVXG7_22125 [Enterobacter hormaechei]